MRHEIPCLFSLEWFYFRILGKQIDMHIPPVWFPIYFISLWLFVTFILSRMGWIHLYREFSSKTPTNGKWLGWRSMRINWIHYRNCIIVYIDETGLYMKPMILFRLFHAPVLIPWERFSKSDERTFRGKTRHLLFLPAPSEVTIPLSESDWKAVSTFIKKQSF